MAQTSANIVVVGGGIIGAAIAWQLTTRGAQVTLIEAGGIGGQATAASWAWTNATAHNPKPYFDLRAASMAEWDRIAAEVPDLTYVRSGTLYADNDRFDTEAFIANHTAWGYDVRSISLEQARQYEPAVHDLEGPLALSESEGAVDATAAAIALATEARKAGAMVFTGIPIEAVSVDGAGRVDGVIMNEAPIKADEVIVAAGAETPRIVEPLGVTLPMQAPRGVLATTKPLPRLIERNILLPGLHVRQQSDGALLAGASFGGEAADLEPEQIAHNLVARIRTTLAGAESAELDHFTVGYRPTPADGFPVVGRPSQIDGLYIATMHSGVTLAPIVARFVADEILDGRRDALLAPFGVDRFRA